MTMTSPLVRDGDTDTPAGGPGSERGEASVPQRMRALASRVNTVIQDEMVLIILLAGAFFARWIVADRRSYWLDELLSVTVYGADNATLLDAVRKLAWQSVHPPLYQASLYVWIELFGTGERATRSLSNVFMTLATLFMYLLMKRLFGRALALTTAVAFTLLYTVTYYGMEARSYALTIFLITLSSWALLGLMDRWRGGGWRVLFLSPFAVVFAAANIGLLLTHYYNVFVWAAQGMLVGLYALRELVPRQWLKGLSAVALMYGVQFFVFSALWGRFLVRAYQRRSDAFAVEGGVRSPLDLAESVIRPNLDPPAVVRWLGFALFVALIVNAVLVLAKRRSTAPSGGNTPDDGGAPARREAWTVAYLVGWLLMPVFVAYLAFVVTGVARYSTRYWLFITPAIAPLVVLVIRETVRLIGRAARRTPAPAAVVAAAVLGIATLIVPGTHRAVIAAAGNSETDWRGPARDIVSIVHSNPDQRYVILETSFSVPPYLDFYLRRFSDDVKVAATIRVRAEEGRAESAIDQLDAEIRRSDFVIVVFIHHGAGTFPTSLALLDSRYERYSTQLDEIGRGLVIYKVK